MANNQNLVIVESPAKAKTISKFLGTDYNVEASMGHLIDLPKSQLGVDVEHDFNPKYITIRGKGEILQKLKRVAKKSDKVLLATDPDREGEAISWHLARALEIDGTSNCRIEFNEITKTAIQAALNEPRPVDQDKVDAQQARRILDRLVGYKLSPLLWKKVRKGLSAGRVQSVAVKIICQREAEIEEFEPQEYWTLETELTVDQQETFPAKLYRVAEEKYELNSQEETEEVIAELEQEKLQVTKIKEGTRRRNPAPPFTTSSLQQQASTYLHFSTKKTMYLAQELYEGIDLGAAGTVGLITYMRTDSTRVSQEEQEDTRDYIIANLGSDYVPDNPPDYKSKSGAQDAHEAIRPTSVTRTPQEVKDYLNHEQYKLYKLIWERFVASQMTPAVYKTLRINVKGTKYWLRANGSRQLFAGFLEVDSSKQSKEDTDLPELEEGAAVELAEVIPEQHFTQPPAKYSEAKLVKTLEQQGIGRPSTYASIVSTIEQRGYVTKENKRFKPTELGEIVNELLIEHFPNVTNIEFTAQLEAELDKIEAGDSNWVQVLDEFYTPFQQRLEAARENMEPVEFPEPETDVICEECGRNMIIKHGRYGKFLACPGFPDCKNTKPLLEKMGVKCPECADGDVVKRKSKQGSVFYGCSNYPECEFMTWYQPVDEECPECGNFLVEKKTKQEIKRFCIAEDCDYEITE
ncbi:type I DNA topoisomerase [Halanaerobaculum tunisiense]